MKAFARILLVIIIVTVVILILNSCGSDTKKQAIIPPPEKSPVTVVWNKKKFNLAQVYPDDHSYPIWVMYPQDSTEQMPLNLNYTQSLGKGSYNQTVVILQ